MQRRASIRGHRKKGYRSPRRTSSPMDHVFATAGLGGFAGDRRRSSVYTTSSGDTAISLDDGTNQDSTQEQIYENIRLHKEVLQSVKLQPWSIKRKLRLVRQAKAYVARHEGLLEERFAKSGSTKDLWARFKILMSDKWQHFTRELVNYSSVLIPWEIRIKEIESHFGSVVASYFTFLRWLFWVNIVIAILISVFIIAPEVITNTFFPPQNGSNREDDDYNYKTMTPSELKVAGNLVHLWDFEGYLKYSPLFYGYYSKSSGAVTWGYQLPLAYFLTALAAYIYSFVATLKKMAENSRTSKLSSKDDESVFSWKLFTGWDYMIGHAETAHNRISSVVLGFKEALLEEAEKKKDTRNWKIIFLRILANLIFTLLLVASATAVVYVVRRSDEMEKSASWWDRNEVGILVSFVTYTYPMIFEFLGFMERLHPRQQLRLQLFRIMLLNLLNLYSLIFATFDKISKFNSKLADLDIELTNLTANEYELEASLQNLYQYTTTLMPSTSATMDTFLTSINATLTDFGSNLSQMENCITIIVNCSKPDNNTLTTSFLLLNLSTTIMPDFSTNITTIPSTTDLSLPRNTSWDYYYLVDDSDNTTGSDYIDFLDDWYSRRKRSVQEPEGIPADPQHDKSVIRNYLANIYAKSTTKNIKNDDATTETPFWNNISSESTAIDLIYETELTSEHNDFSNNTLYDDQMSTLSMENDYIFEETLDENCTEIICFPITTQFFDDTTEISSTIISTTDKLSTVNYLNNIRDINYYEAELRNITLTRAKINMDLKKLCWETMFGQSLAKIILMDEVVSICTILVIDFFRALFVRFMNSCWCWDLEKKFPQYGDFKIAENILQLVYNQGQVWMGMFFSPGLAIMNLVKLVIIMYIRSWAVITCNVPHEVVFRISRSNNFYLTLLLCMLFLCVLPVGYAIVWLKPSGHCGPFAKRTYFFDTFTQTLINALPEDFHKPLAYLASASTVIPLLVLLILIIYYLVSLTSALREANQDLKNQLRKERSEEHKKMFRITNEKLTETVPTSITDRWKKVLEASSPVTPTAPSTQPELEDPKALARKELLTRIMRRALRKESATSEDDSIPVHPNEEDETDTEHHDSLPHDEDGVPKKIEKIKRRGIYGRRGRKPSIIDVVQLMKKESAVEQHPNSRFKIDQTIAEKSDGPESTVDENDPETNMKIVSERRRSLLRRQQKIQESSGSSIQEKDDINTNYEIINEKNKEVEKQSKLKMASTFEPEIFKFDDSSLKKTAGTSKSESPSETHAATEVLRKLLQKKLSAKLAAKSIEPGPATPDIKHRTPALMEKIPGAPKARKKLGSFLALVKEAVNTKKDDIDNKDTCNTPDISSPISEYEEMPERDEFHPLSRTSSHYKPKTDRGPKRQDSQTSIWSENIPVITISKTESDECILESSHKDTDIDTKKSHDKPNNN